MQPLRIRPAELQLCRFALSYVFALHLSGVAGLVPLLERTRERRAVGEAWQRCHHHSVRDWRCQVSFLIVCLCLTVTVCLSFCLSAFLQARAAGARAGQPRSDGHVGDYSGQDLL